MLRQNIIFNIGAGNKNALRRETLNGREHLVVPTVMIKEGVHSGSQGAIYYPSEQLARSVHAWNNKPLVVYHPEINGQPMSACDPVILNTRSVGVILNTKYDTKLRTESWIDIERANKVDKRVIERVENGEMMECSTGLLINNPIREEGEHDGKPYKIVANELIPDHLALLPDRIGACSIADGAGLFQLNESNIPYLQQLVEHLSRRGNVVNNELSHNAVFQALASIVRKSNGDSWDGWIEDVFDSFFVYSMGGKLYRLSYLQSDSTVTVVGQPEEVAKVTEYKTTTGKTIGEVKANNEEPKLPASVPVVNAWSPQARAAAAAARKRNAKGKSGGGGGGDAKKPQSMAELLGYTPEQIAKLRAVSDVLGKPGSSGPDRIVGMAPGQATGLESSMGPIARRKAFEKQHGAEIQRRAEAALPTGGSPGEWDRARKAARLSIAREQRPTPKKSELDPRRERMLAQDRARRAKQKAAAKPVTGVQRIFPDLS